MPVKKQLVYSKAKQDVINRKIKSIKKSRSNINCLRDIIEELNCNEAPVVCSVLKTLPALFSTLQQRGDLTIEPHKSDNDVEAKFHAWVLDRYVVAKEHTIKLLDHNDPNIRNSSFLALFHYLKNEVNFDDQSNEFMLITFKNVLEHLLHKSCTRSSIRKLQQYLKYPDVTYHVVLCLDDVLKKLHMKKVDRQFISNAIYLMKLLEIPNRDAQHELFFPGIRNKGFSFPYKTFKKMLSSVWLTILKADLTQDHCKEILLGLHNHVLPHMENPLLLTDFFMDSYAHGGLIGLLSLNGVFYLMQNFNLEYPNFYSHLYSLMDSNLVFLRNKQQVYTILDLFLSSTHLPEYLVAAFVKKFSRLALKAPVPTCIILLKLLNNLFIRHKGLRKMYDNPTEMHDVQTDPYREHEADLLLCCALDSSLWEIETLQHHCVPHVEKAAKFILHPLSRDDIDISKYLHNSYEEIVQSFAGKDDEVELEENHYSSHTEFMAEFECYWEVE